MRRPMLIICIMVLVLAFLFTRDSYNSKQESEEIKIQGVVTKIEYKDKYVNYDVGKYLVQTYNKYSDIELGDNIEVKGESKDLNSLKNDDFNYGLYLKSKGYKGLVYLEKFNVIGENYIIKKIGMLRNYISETFKYLYKDKSGIINSLVIGIRSDLSSYENQLFSKNGINHIISISGLHVGIIASMVILFIGNVNKLYKLVFIILTMAIYSLIVGDIPSIQRAILFSVISYVSFFIDERHDERSSLSLIAILMVIRNPYIIYNLSFQLSFLATLSIIYFRTYIKEFIKLDILAITISANILTLPLVYYHFKTISVVSLISNILVVPIIGLIIYMAVGSILVFKYNVVIAKWIAQVCVTLINLIYIILEKLAKLKFAYIEIENPKAYYVIMYYVIMFVFMIGKEMENIKEQENELQGYY